MSSNNIDLAALNKQQELDSKLGTTTRIPRLTDANDFPEWKWRFEQHLKVKDYKLWRSILRGPREIMMDSSTEPGVKVKKPKSQYTEDDLLIIEEDERALSYLTMGFCPDIAIGFRTCKSAKELWESLIDVYEGNEDMKESRRNLLRQNFNNFNHIYGETVDNQIQRFVKLVTQMQMEEIHTSNASTNRQLLNALPKSWDHHVAMIKKTKDLARCSLSEMISHIKACELDDKQRETNYKNSMLAAGFSVAPTSSNNNNAALLSQGGFQMFSNAASAKAAPTSANVYCSGSSTQVTPSHFTVASASAVNASTAASASTVKNEMIAFFTQQSKENLDIAASVINCLNAFVAGKIDPPKWCGDDLHQIHPDDVVKACELDDKQRETNYKNSMLAAGFSVAPTSSNNNNAALLSQGGFQMFSNAASAKAAPTSANVYCSGSSTQVTPSHSTVASASAVNASTAASASTVKNEMIAFFTQQSKENLDIASSVINCLNAFVAGKNDPPKWCGDDLHHIHPDDVEEMDITWQMAMAAFRATRFMKRTGKNKWGASFTGASTVPFNLRCYNCHEEGHYARNCTKPPINREQTPAQPVTPNRERALVTTSSIMDDAATSGNPQPLGLAQALVVQPDINFDWSSEIERLNISAPDNKNESNNIAFMTSTNQGSEPEEETSAENFALMTQILSAPVKGLTKEEVLSVFCTPECRERVEAYRIHNTELIQDYQDIKNKNFTLSKNEKLYKEKIEAQRKDIIKLKDDVSVRTAHFLEAQEKVCVLTKELEDIRDRYQINELNIKKFDSSSKLVKNLCDQQLAFKEKKGRGLGYNQTPPPYNDNYTYLPMSEEEMMNESKMTYGPKNLKSSFSGRPVEKQKSTPLNFVYKGSIDPNVSSSCADEFSEVKCGDVHGSEPVVHSNISENYFGQTESDIAFGRSLFASFSAYVSSSEPVILGKTDDVCVESLNNKCGDDRFSVNACDCNVSNVSVDDSVTGEVPQDIFSETTETSSQENQEYPDSSSESVSVGVPNVESSGTPLETVVEIEPELVSHDKCIDEMHIDETSTCSNTETEFSNEEKGIEINAESLEKVFEFKTSTSNDARIKESVSNCSSTSHDCVNSNQQPPKCSEQPQAKHIQKKKRPIIQNQENLIKIFKILTK
ncbi:putative transcription factor interactor and regulator CCHC(Zn) family [Helianthus annuus]|nr:putative transcription factor interactor and regulator CCHC(Zn) family [Helianthus annuus]